MRNGCSLAICMFLTLALQLAPSAMANPTQASGSQPPQSERVRTDHLISSLVASAESAAAGESIGIGLLLEHDPHWHTYWKNSGDSGLPTRISLELPEGVTAGDIQWPAPYRFDVEDIVNFGFGDRQLLPINLKIDKRFPHAMLNVRASASWLICEVECIPGRADYELRIPVSETAGSPSAWQEDFLLAEKRLPTALPGQARFRVDDDRMHVDIISDRIPAGIAAFEVFPEQSQIVRNGAYPMWTKIDGGLRMSLPLSEYFADLPAVAPLVLVKDDQAISIRALPAAAEG